MNPLAIITWFVVACALVGVSAGIAALVMEHRRQQETPDEAERPEPRGEYAEPAGMWIELAEQRRELDELRSEVEQLRRQPG